MVPYEETIHLHEAFRYFLTSPHFWNTLRHDEGHLSPLPQVCRRAPPFVVTLLDAYLGSESAQRNRSVGAEVEAGFLARRSHEPEAVIGPRAAQFPPGATVVVAGQGQVGKEFHGDGVKDAELTLVHAVQAGFELEELKLDRDRQAAEILYGSG